MTATATDIDSGEYTLVDGWIPEDEWRVLQYQSSPKLVEMFESPSERRERLERQGAD